MPSHIPNGQFHRAEHALLQALRSNPDDAGAGHRLARLYQEHGRPADAASQYENVVRLRPQDADALYHLGLALAELGRSDDALDCYRRAVAARPGFAPALCNLGVALAQRGRLAEAEEHLRRAVEADPNFAQAHHNLGVALAQQGFAQPAIKSLRKAIDLQPGYAEAYFNLANTLPSLGYHADSIDAYREALRCRPDYPEVLCNLGLALSEGTHAGEAAVLLRQATRLRPDYVEAHNNLGLALAELGRFEEAIPCYERALTLRPRYAAAHANLGSAYKALGRPEEAAACYEMALRYEPDSASAHWNLALARLLAGDFERGWREYEWRWKRPSTPPRPLKRPLWEGLSLSARTIMLWCEQGLGDAIQFARYAPLVQAKGGRVILECPDPLKTLFRSLEGVDELVPEGTQQPFDCHAPLMSLPGLLHTTLATVPADVPYFKADPDLVHRWRGRLDTLDGFRVGIAWQGNPHHKWDRWRSVSLAQFAPLAWVPGVTLVSLQHGPGTEQLERPKARFAVNDLGKELTQEPGPWAQMAAVMTCLDLVVSVDTATAHLAGALDVPVWVPLSTLVDFRWLLNRDDSPWYPTMRLFRQRHLGDWEPVFSKMAVALRVAARRDK